MIFIFSIADEVLRGIQHQVTQKDFLYIINILQKAQSTFYKQIQGLIEQISDEIAIAVSNIRYMKLLTILCDDLNAVDRLTAASLKLPKFINMILFIKLSSDYLATNKIASDLFCKLTNQIILFCQKRINIQEAFAAKPTVGIKHANEAIDLCLYYKIIFERIAEKMLVQESLDVTAIFNYLNIFIQRLYDFIEICNGLIIFEQNNDVEVMPEPLFGGIRGKEFENCCLNIKTTFTIGMGRIRAAEANFLDVHNCENVWSAQIQKYHEMVRDLEERIENLIRNVFEDIGNVEEGIVALSSLYYYSLRPNIRAPYMKNTVKVWRMFAEEISITNKQLTEQIHIRNSQVGRFAGRASDLATNGKRIARIKQLFLQAEWMPEYAYAEKVCFAFHITTIRNSSARLIKFFYFIFRSYTNNHKWTQT